MQQTLPSSLTNLSAKIRSDPIMFESSRCSSDHIDTLHCEKKSTSVMIGSIKMKKFIHPQIFDQESLQTQRRVS